MRISCVFDAYCEYKFPILRIMRILRKKRIKRIMRKPSMMRMLRITGIVFYSRITAMITVRASQAQANH